MKKDNRSIFYNYQVIKNVISNLIKTIKIIKNNKKKTIEWSFVNFLV